MSIKKIQGQVEKSNNIHYEFDSDSTPLGEGGMGVVYRGVRVDEISGVRSEVAIKALHDELPEDVYARAEREASIQLRHDNLVEMLGMISMHEVNRWGETITHHYVISELLHGIELSDVLKGRIEDRADHEYPYELYRKYLNDRESTSIQIFRNILSGVMALHDKGYIHRDIDPSNIMVTDDGHIKLIDFGIAKDLTTLGSKDKLMTAAGKFMGKAEFASPELVLGDVHNQNYTTDIYALGILFYRLLVGNLPFEGSQYEVLQNQLKSKVPVKNITNKALARIVRKATEKVQSNRYASIAELRVAIDSAEMYRPGIFNHFGKYIFICLIGLILIGGLICYRYLSQKDSEQTDSPLQVNTESTMESRFQEALLNLESEDSSSVKSGFDELLKLSHEKYDRANVELAVIYYSLRTTPRDIRSDEIVRRRSILGLKDNNLKELEKSLAYFNSITDRSLISPECNYLLGILYYATKDGSERIEKTLNSFRTALTALENGEEVSHGYNDRDLRYRLEQNIKSLE